MIIFKENNAFLFQGIKGNRLFSYDKRDSYYVILSYLQVLWMPVRWNVCSLPQRPIWTRGFVVIRNFDNKSVLNDNYEISDIIYAVLFITRFKRNIIFVTQDTPIHDVPVRLQYVLERIFSQLTSAIPGRLSISRYAKIKHWTLSKRMIDITR